MAPIVAQTALGMSVRTSFLLELLQTFLQGTIAYPTFNVPHSRFVGLRMYLCTLGSRGRWVLAVFMELRWKQDVISTLNLLEKVSSGSAHNEVQYRCPQSPTCGKAEVNKSGPSTAAIRFRFEFFLAGRRRQML